MFGNGFNFEAFIDFVSRAIKSISIAHLFFVTWFLFNKYKMKEKFELSPAILFLVCIGCVDWVIRLVHAFSGRATAGRYYFMESILLIFPAVLGVVLFRYYLCKRKGRNPIYMMSVIIIVISLVQLGSIFKPRKHKEYIFLYAKMAPKYTDKVFYVFGDDSRVNHYMGISKKVDNINSSVFIDKLKASKEIAPNNIFYLLKDEKKPSSYNDFIVWKELHTHEDHKGRKVSLWQGEEFRNP